MNNKSRLKEYVNSKTSNILGFIVVIVAIGLGLKSLAKVFGLM